MPEGPGYAIDRSGSRLLQGHFHRGKLTGYGRIITASDTQGYSEAMDLQIQCMSGTFDYGHPHGICQVNFNDDGVRFFEGTFVRGNQIGPGIEINALNGTVKEGYYD